jgi:glycosyltransferase involved in cell wall biosynthesis
MNARSPFFSVIIPTYNRAHTIERAVRSVFAQTQDSYELIIVDDGSTDKTQEILTFFAKNKPNNVFVKLLKTDHKGVSAARNHGVEYASGRWISFLDSDDEWLPQKLQMQKDFIEKNPSLRLVHGEEIWIRNGVRVNQRKIHQKSGGDIFERATELCLISPSAVAIEKKLFTEQGGFRTDYPVCEDYDLWLKICSENLIGFLKHPVVNKFGGHEDQLSTQYKAMDYYRVKSLKWILENRDLDISKRHKAIEVGLNKCIILINGYKKHNNTEKLSEVLGFQLFFQSV